MKRDKRNRTLASLGFNAKEIEAIEQMAVKMDLSPERILRCAVSQYQTVVYGHAKLKWKSQPVGLPEFD